MRGLWKIVKIILVFFLSLSLISLVWYGIELNSFGEETAKAPFIDFLLYLLGYGDLQLRDHYLQTVFSTLGLFAVTLLSSVFTVSLFELRSRVSISPKLVVSDRSSARLKLKASGKDIYNLTATLIAKCGSEVITEEQYFPFIAKNTAETLTFRMEPGTVLYKYLRAVFRGDMENPQLILTAVYTDIESGQTYTLGQKYQYSSDKKKSIIFSGDPSQLHNGGFEKEIRAAILNNTFRIDLMSVAPCNGEDIDITYGYCGGRPSLDPSNAFRADVHMNSDRLYEPGSFTMAYTADLLGNDWSKYYDLGCALKFDCMVQGNIAVTFELKYAEGGTAKKECLFTGKGDFASYCLPLRQLNREDLKNVREMCFTVFYKHVDPEDPTGSFVVKNCVLEVEDL